MVLPSAKALSLTDLQIEITRQPLVVPPEMAVTVAIAQMDQAGDDCVVVVEAEQVVGLFAERDVVRLVRQQSPLGAQTLGEVVTQPVTLRESALTGTLNSTEALALFQQHGIRHLPLVDEGDRLTGLLTEAGLQQAMISQAEGKACSPAEVHCQAILTAIPDFIVRVGADGCYRGFSSPIQGFSLVSPEVDLTGRYMEELLPAEVAERQYHYLHQALATGEIQVYQQQIHRGDCWQDEEVRVSKSGEDEVLFIIRDITEQKQAERALRQSEQLHRTLCETQPDLIIQMDREGNYQRRVGGDAFRIRDLSNGEVATVHDILPPELAKEQIDYAHQALETGQLQTFEHSFEFSGQHHYEEVRIAPLDHQNVLIVVRDISEHKQLEAERQKAEAALIENEHRFRTLFEDTPKLAMQGYNRDRRVIYWNSASEQLYGYSATEAIGQPIEDLLLFPEEQAQTVEMLRDWASGASLPASEMSLRTQSGEPVAVFSNHITFTNRHGEPEFYCVDIDLSPLKQAEQQLQTLNQSLEATVLARTEALREREQFLETVLDTFPLAVFWKDTNSVYQGCNRNFLHHTGLASVTELIGKTDHDLPWSADEDQVYWQQDRQIMDAGGPMLGIIETQRQADGHQIWIETHKLPLRNLAGEVIGILGTYQDISEKTRLEADRQQAQARLQASEARYRALIEVIPDLMIRLHADGTRLDVVAGEGVTLLTPETTVVGNVYGSSPEGHAEQRMAYVQRALQTREIQVCDYEILIGGQLHCEEARIVAINDQEVLVMVRDITDRKQAEAKLRRYERIVSATADGIAMVDRNYVYQIVNQTYIERNGKPQAEIVGYSVAELLGEQAFLEQIKPNLDRCLAGEVVQYQDWFDHGGVGQRFINASYAPYREVDGTISGVVVGTCDLTDQKRLEQQLHQTSQQFQTFVENAPAAISCFDRDGRYLQVNQACADCLGMPANEIIGRTFADFSPEAQAQTFLHRIQTVIDTGQPLEVEDEVQLGGETLTFQCILFANGDREPTNFWSISTDITDRKQSEAQIQEITQRLALATSAAHLGIWDWSPLQEQLIWDDQMYALHGTTPEQFGGTYAAWKEEFLHPDDWARVEAEAEAVMAGEGDYHSEFRVVWPDGQVRCLESRALVLRDEAGHPQRLIGINWDITERKQAETDLQQSEWRFRQAIASAPFPLIIHAEDGEILQINQTWTELTGYTHRDLPTAQAWAQRAYGDRALEMLKVIAKTYDLVSRDSSQGEFAITTQAGNQRLWEFSSAPLGRLPDGRRAVISAAVDISDRKQTETALQNLAAITATGPDFFTELVSRIGEVLEVPHVMVTKRVEATLQTLAFWSDGALQPNFAYAHAQTPCGRALAEGLFYCEAQVQQYFPNDADLVDLGAASYLGVALHNAEGQPIGKLCILDRGPLRHPQRAEQLLKIFAARAAAELQRQQVITALEQLNNTLETRVVERTEALLDREMRYHTLMEGASDAILVIDRGGHVVEVNHQAERLLGYPRAELTRLHIAQLRPPEDEAQTCSAFEQIIQQSHSQLLDITLLCQDGDQVSVDVSAAALEINGETLIQAIVRDISDRKRLETDRKLLLQELSEFKLALDQSAIVATTDAKGVITYVNHLFCKVSGYRAEELLGFTHRVVNSGQHPPEFFQNLWRTIGSGAIWRGEICNRTKAGDLYWVESTIVPFLNDQGEPFQYLTIRFDITSRKQAEQTIRLQAQREKLLRETGQLIRESLDLPTIFNTACEEICALLQADRVAIFKFDPASGFIQGEFVAESMVDGVRSVLEEPVEDDCFGEDYATPYSKGRFFLSDDIYDQNLSPCHIDILAQFQVRACLVMPLLCGDRLWGLLCVHQCSGPRHWHWEEASITQRLAVQLAIAIQQASFYEQLQQELTQRQQAQQQLIERNQELDRSNQELARATRLKDEFLANMSHELRTPLNAILGMAEGLQEQVFGPTTPEQIKAAQTIERGGNHLLDLINDILDVAKIEAGQMELHCTAVAVGPLCRSSLAFVKQQAQKKGIQLATQLPVDLPDLWVDERRILQVLINLLTNAVKFTNAGGRVTLEVSRQQQTQLPIDPEPLQGITRVKVYQTPLEQNLARRTEENSLTVQDYLRIAVIDTGIGIDPTNLHKLFQPFVQIDSALNRQYEGTGLGLALVKRVVELHGGQVALSSKLGVGSRFSIDLPCCWRCPVAPEAETNTASQGHTELRSSPETTGALILLAEDNEANVCTVSSYLKAKGYKVVVANDGQTAISQAQAKRPAVILMDVQMPKIDGLEAIRQLRQDPAFVDIPIIALTALAMTGDRDRCLAAGATDYLTKPVKLKQLTGLIQQLLARV
jgi:PAS domain S-box-containing protein